MPIKWPEPTMYPIDPLAQALAGVRAQEDTTARRRQQSLDEFGKLFSNIKAQQDIHTGNIDNETRRRQLIFQEAMRPLDLAKAKREKEEAEFMRPFRRGEKETPVERTKERYKTFAEAWKDGNESLLRSDLYDDPVELEKHRSTIRERRAFDPDMAGAIGAMSEGDFSHPGVGKIVEKHPELFKSLVNNAALFGRIGKQGETQKEVARTRADASRDVAAGHDAARTSAAGIRSASDLTRALIALAGRAQAARTRGTQPERNRLQEIKSLIGAVKDLYSIDDPDLAARLKPILDDQITRAGLDGAAARIRPDVPDRNSSVAADSALGTTDRIIGAFARILQSMPTARAGQISNPPSIRQPAEPGAAPPFIPGETMDEARARGGVVPPAFEPRSGIGAGAPAGVLAAAGRQPFTLDGTTPAPGAMPNMAAPSPNGPAAPSGKDAFGDMAWEPGGIGQGGAFQPGPMGTGPGVAPDPNGVFRSPQGALGAMPNMAAPAPLALAGTSIGGTPPGLSREAPPPSVLPPAMDEETTRALGLGTADRMREGAMARGVIDEGQMAMRGKRNISGTDVRPVPIPEEHGGGIGWEATQAHQFRARADSHQQRTYPAGTIYRSVGDPRGPGGYAGIMPVFVPGEGWKQSKGRGGAPSRQVGTPAAPPTGIRLDPDGSGMVAEGVEVDGWRRMNTTGPMWLNIKDGQTKLAWQLPDSVQKKLPAAETKAPPLTGRGQSATFPAMAATAAEQDAIMPLDARRAFAALMTAGNVPLEQIGVRDPRRQQEAMDALFRPRPDSPDRSGGGTGLWFVYDDNNDPILMTAEEERTAPGHWKRRPITASEVEKATLITKGQSDLVFGSGKQTPPGMKDVNVPAGATDLASEKVLKALDKERRALTTGGIDTAYEQELRTIAEYIKEKAAGVPEQRVRNLLDWKPRGKTAEARKNEAAQIASQIDLAFVGQKDTENGRKLDAKRKAIRAAHGLKDPNEGEQKKKVTDRTRRLKALETDIAAKRSEINAFGRDFSVPDAERPAKLDKLNSALNQLLAAREKALAELEK